jgi:membrane-associated phospholipid phosphatase
MPILVALSRLYRGEHHPTDILGSLIFAALWLTATCWLIKPNAARRVPPRPEPGAESPRGLGRYFQTATGAPGT